MNFESFGIWKMLPVGLAEFRSNLALVEFYPLIDFWRYDFAETEKHCLGGFPNRFPTNQSIACIQKAYLVKEYENWSKLLAKGLGKPSGYPQISRKYSFFEKLGEDRFSPNIAFVDWSWLDGEVFEYHKKHFQTFELIWHPQKLAKPHSILKLVIPRRQFAFWFTLFGVWIFNLARSRAGQKTLWNIFYVIMHRINYAARSTRDGSILKSR